MAFNCIKSVLDNRFRKSHLRRGLWIFSSLLWDFCLDSSSLKPHCRTTRTSSCFGLRAHWLNQTVRCQRQWLGNLRSSFRTISGHQQRQGGEESCHTPDPDWWTNLPVRPKVGRPSRSEDEKLRRVDCRTDSAFCPCPSRHCRTPLLSQTRPSAWRDGGYLRHRTSAHGALLWLRREPRHFLPRLLRLLIEERGWHQETPAGKGSWPAKGNRHCHRHWNRFSWHCWPGERFDNGSTGSSPSRDNCFRCGRMGWSCCCVFFCLYCLCFIIGAWSAYSHCNFLSFCLVAAVVFFFCVYFLVGALF